MNCVPEIELSIPLQAGLLPVATAYVEQSVRAFGLRREEALALALAMEEVYSFLAAKAAGGQAVKVTCRYGGYYAEVICRFASRALPVRALNITAAVSSDDKKPLRKRGLLWAARTVDRLRISSEDDTISVHFIKEKVYPPAPEAESGAFTAKGPFRVCGGEPEFLKQFARRVVAVYGRQAPAFSRFPGKVIDMVADGEYGVTVLADENRNVGGGMFWRNDGKMAEAYGPYVFSGQPQIARDVVEACLKKLARTGAVCLVIPAATAQAPQNYFEPLGQLPVVVDGVTQTQQALYRQLEEDNGSVTFVHPCLVAFARDTYERLYLPRQVEAVEYQGERLSPYSAFAARMDRPAKKAVLSSLWVGEDAAANLAEHVLTLRQEGIANIFFKTDAGVAEQALLGPALLAAGFVPRLIFPREGRGDTILFAYQEREHSAK